MTDLVTTVTKTVSEDRDISDQLRNRLDHADELEKTVQDLTNQLESANKQLGVANNELRALKALELRSDNLDEREKHLEAKQNELNLREELNQVKLDAQMQRVLDHQKMVELIFRNSSIRKQGKLPLALDGGSSVVHGVNGDIAQQNGGYVGEGSFSEETIED